jgi:hypothetical protein
MDVDMQTEIMSNDDAQAMLSCMVCDERYDLGATDVHVGFHPEVGQVTLIVDSTGRALALIKKRVAVAV